MESNRSVEEDIIRSARHVFVEKGYDGATMREIAAGAGINISMLHYYFRSKDNMFDIVFEDVFRRMYGKIFEAIADDKDIFEKISAIVGLYVDTLVAEPRLPNFIFNEVTQRPDRSGRFAGYKEYVQQYTRSFQKQLDRAAGEGRIRRVSVMELIVDIESLCVYPFLTGPLWQKVFDVSPEDFIRMVENKKEIFTRNIIKSLER